MKKAIVFQVAIFIAAYFVMTPDVMEDNTHVFGLFGSYDIIHGNSIWVLAGAAILSIINLWVWWPKKVKVANTPETTKDTKSAEVKAEDPVVPKMD